MIQICVTLTEPSVVALIDRMADLAGRADMFEIRGDYLEQLDLLTILRARTEPLLFTCRSQEQGGRWRGEESRRRMILLEAVRRGFDYVDVEYESRFMEVVAEKTGRGLVLSHHDLEGVPEDLDELYSEMREMGADVVKIAVTPRSMAEVGRFLAFASRTSRSGGPPLVPIAMGPLGVVSRVITGRYAAPFTFACPEPGSEGAPGQVPLDEMRDVYRAGSVSPSTRLYGVLGSDVSRSLSPRLHNAAFAASEVDAVYVPFSSPALEPFLTALPALEVAGFSVTRPFKQEIIPHLQKLEAQAEASGSVNTVVVESGKLHGSSTDGAGVVAALASHVALEGAEVLILGAGGAARAAARALIDAGARVTVMSRDPARAAVVADALGCSWGNLDHVAGCRWDVLINATPVGSDELSDETPVPAELHRPGTVVLDMVYEPRETRLLREARAAGAQGVGGLEMLIAQAARQFETWTGKPAPLEAMRAAVDASDDAG
jgi:3-dehydroquinate dehydratase/shikimate dehydrogenase